MKYYFTRWLFLALICVLSANLAFADFNEEKIKDELPMLLGSTNQGTEFVMTFHPCWEESGASNELKIYVASAVATVVTLEIPALQIVKQITTSPNEVHEFGLSPTTGQMYSKDDKDAPQPQQVYKGRACIITSDDPIVCYGVTRYNYTSDGYLAIPTYNLGKEYIVSSWNDPTQDNLSQYLTSYTSIVAAYDNTTVEFTLGGERSNYTPGANSIVIGDKATNKMDRGDVWLIGVNGDYSDLSGSLVSADKPVAVISGSFCAYVPVQNAACDFLIEQDLPMESWGNKYHVTPIADRKYASYIRVYASKPNTYIYNDGMEWGKINTVGGLVDKGYLSRRAILEGDSLRPITLSADDPISVTQYNTGQAEDKVPSDPFQMVLTPISQYQKSIIFCTPGIRGGLPFMRNYLNLCYQSTKQGEIPDDMEFGIGLNGSMSWVKLNEKSTNSGIAFNDPDVTDGRDWKSLTITLDDPSATYAIRGDTKFAAYGYGFGNYDSYGWPVAAAMSDLTKPDVWPPSVEYSVDCYGKVTGTVYDEPRNVDSLRSNFSNISLSNSQSYNYKMIWDKEGWVPGEVAEVEWQLEIQNTKQDAKATVYFADRSGNDTTITIEFEHVYSVMSPRITNWGMVKSNDNANSKELTFTNPLSKSIMVDSLVLLSQDVNKTWGEKGFRIDPAIYADGTLPAEIPAGAEFKFNVIFDPTFVKEEFINGQTSFTDSVGVKANWSDDYQEYSYYSYNAAVKATIGLPATTLISPENNTTKIASLTTFEWVEIPEALMYRLQVSTDASFKTAVINEEVTNNTYTVSTNLESGTTYYWRVISLTGSSESEWSEVWTYKTALSVPMLQEPVDGYNHALNNKQMFIWEPAKGANYYQLQIANDEAFTSLEFSKDSLYETSYIIEALEANNQYYWRVRARDDSEASDWSETWSFTTEPASAVNDENVLAGSDIKIIPNPATDNILIPTDILFTSAKIYDLAGNLLLEANTHKIDVSKLVHGTYVIVIETKNKTERATFIKE